MAESEDKLVSRLKAGNMEAYEEVVCLYEKKIFNLAYRMVGNYEDANDLTQEVFVRLYHSIHSFRGDAQFSTWLYRIANNVCVDELRRRYRRKIEYLDEPIDTKDGSVRREIADWTSNPENILETHEIQACVQEGINALTEEQRTAVILRDIQGFSYEEIAKILSCSLGTVKSRINRGRQSLKERLAGRRELFGFNKRQ
ncbi:MAG: sigma-70 family RNA polymerase sigma factor [bacterium]|jgi:RNA polymerase sigma-70 factor (ECF subfamily)